MERHANKTDAHPACGKGGIASSAPLVLSQYAERRVRQEAWTGCAVCFRKL